MPLLDLNTSFKDFIVSNKSDTVNYPDGKVARALYVGGAGTVVAVRTDGVAVSFTSVTAGTILPIAHIRVNNTFTTATNMIALF